jgi:hypothetical protein
MDNRFPQAVYTVNPGIVGHDGSHRISRAVIAAGFRRKDEYDGISDYGARGVCDCAGYPPRKDNS